MGKLSVNFGGLNLDFGFNVSREEAGALFGIMVAATDDEGKRAELVDMAKDVLSSATPTTTSTEQNRRSTDREQQSVGHESGAADANGIQSGAGVVDPSSERGSNPLLEQEPFG